MSSVEGRGTRVEGTDESAGTRAVRSVPKRARQLFDLVVKDMETLKTNPLCYRLVSQQIGSADSICANIEEGYGRVSRAEYVRFLDFARGSARETRGRYERMKHWLAPEVVVQRIDLSTKSSAS